MSGNYNGHDLRRLKKALRAAQCRLNECEGLLTAAEHARLNIKEQSSEIDRHFAEDAADVSIDTLIDRMAEAHRTLHTTLGKYQALPVY
jgi:hypothetical protein